MNGVDCSGLPAGFWPRVLEAMITLFPAAPFIYFGYRRLRYNASIAAKRVVPENAFFFSWGPKLFGSFMNDLTYLRSVVIMEGLAMMIIAAIFGFLVYATIQCASK